MAENVIELTADAAYDELTRPKSFWYKAFHQIIRNPRAILGFSVLLVLVLAAVFADQITPYDPYKTNYSNVKQPPSAEHFIGTDELGRDGFSRLIYGARISLMVGITVSSISVSIGVALGAIAGYFGGIADMIIMRVVDLMMAFPFLVLAIALVAVFGPSLFNMMLALIVVYWIWFARVVRGMVLTLRETEFIVGAKAAGASDISIIFRHILPNVFPGGGCAGLLQRRRSHPHRRHAELSGAGRAAASRRMGLDAEQRQRADAHLARDVDRARRRHHDHGARDQFHRRCPARRPRPHIAPIVCIFSGDCDKISLAPLLGLAPRLRKLGGDFRGYAAEEGASANCERIALSSEVRRQLLENPPASAMSVISR